MRANKDNGGGTTELACEHLRAGASSKTTERSDGSTVQDPIVA